MKKLLTATLAKLTDPHKKIDSRGPISTATAGFLIFSDLPSALTLSTSSTSAVCAIEPRESKLISAQRFGAGDPLSRAESGQAFCAAGEILKTSEYGGDTPIIRTPAGCIYQSARCICTKSAPAAAALSASEHAVCRSALCLFSERTKNHPQKPHTACFTLVIQYSTRIKGGGWVGG